MRLSWGDVDHRRYESGLDRGVFYDADRHGVVWDGLIAVTESKKASVTPVYFDGVKVNDVFVSGETTAQLEAFTYPDEFLPYTGVRESGTTGLYLLDQPPDDMFHISYRTRKTQADGRDGYLIHLWYNLTAAMHDIPRHTINDNPEAITFVWDLHAIPENVGGFAPTAHIVLDSTMMSRHLLKDVEAMLYGSETEEARLPDLNALVAYVMKWRRMIITDNDDGTWTADAYFDTDIEINGDVFTINNANATFLDATTYEISDTVENREDVWQP